MISLLAVVAPPTPLGLTDVATLLGTFAGIGVVLWGAMEIVAQWYTPPDSELRQKLTMSLSIAIGVLFATTLKGVGVLPQLGDTPWGWVLAGLLGLISTVTAKATNDLVVNPIKKKLKGGGQ